MRRLAPLLILLWAVLPAAALAGAKADDHLVVGLKAYRDGFYELAAKELRAFLDARPDDPRRGELLDLLFRADLARGDEDAARADLEALAALGGERAPKARYWLGWLALRRGDPAGALVHLEASLAQGGEQADARYLAGMAALRAGRSRDAVKHLETFLREHPGDPRRARAWQALVEAVGRAGDPAEAVRTARRALADPAVASDPAVAVAVARAGLAAAAGPRERAAFWRVLAEKAPDPGERLDALVEEGLALAEAGDGQAARRVLERCLAESPEGPRAAEAHLALSDLARKRGDPAAALDHLEAALGLLPPRLRERRLDLERAAFGLALKLKDEARAARHARALLEHEGTLPAAERDRAHLVLARDAARKGNGPEALAHWDAVAPGSRWYRQARLEAARWLLDRGKPGEAEKRLDPILGDDPGGEAHALALAAAEARKDHPRAARLALSLAGSAADPALRAGYLERAAVHLQQAGDEQGYRRVLERLAGEAPGTREGTWAAGELQRMAYEAGDWEAVLRWSEGARKSDPTGAAAYREAEALLETGHPARARRIFETLARRPAPVGPLALARLALLDDRAGRTEAARKGYREALASGGLPPEMAAWVRERLRALGGKARDRDP